MIFKRFRFVCAIRVIFLSATIFLFFYIIFRTTLYITYVLFIPAIIYQIYALINYVERTNRDLVRFLESIKYQDFSQSFSSRGAGASFKELSKALTEVTNEFRQARTEKEEHYRYLQTIVQHIGIGLIAFHKNGNVELINNAAKRLLKITHLKNIKMLESFSPQLVKILQKMQTGDQKLVKIEKNNDQLQLAIYATEFKIRNQNITLVSLQNIQSELEEKEMEAWQNLIRVLTHEIMNSVTPIASLASTVNDLLLKPQSEDKLTIETITDIRDAVRTIQNRSQGLLHFVDSYRQLTRIPRPDFQIFPIRELFSRVEQLMQPQLKEKSIQNFSSYIDPESLELTADPGLIEQVLINLLINAIEAVHHQPQPKIKMCAGMDQGGRIFIQVIDNGSGIIEDVQEKIFIPFFTTKKQGTGIGLSLSRQIMRLHKGTISVLSKPNLEPIFTLRF